MSLSETLARAAKDVERGELGRARDRLQGLLAAYPEELEIRRRLGEIYWSLQYPERAGCYWYLLPSDRPEMETAKRAFARQYGGNPWAMLKAIHYNGGIESVRGTYAGDALHDLADRAHLSPSRLEAVLRKREPGRPLPPPAQSWSGRVLGWAVLLVLCAIFVLVLIGGYTVLHFMGEWINR